MTFHPRGLIVTAAFLLVMMVVVMRPHAVPLLDQGWRIVEITLIGVLSLAAIAAMIRQRRFQADNPFRQLRRWFRLDR